VDLLVKLTATLQDRTRKSKGEGKEKGTSSLNVLSKHEAIEVAKNYNKKKNGSPKTQSKG
jgi:hypothetical protein